MISAVSSRRPCDLLDNLFEISWFRPGPSRAASNTQATQEFARAIPVSARGAAHENRNGAREFCAAKENSPPPRSPVIMHSSIRRCASLRLTVYDVGDRTTARRSRNLTSCAVKINGATLELRAFRQQPCRDCRGPSVNPKLLDSPCLRMSRLGPPTSVQIGPDLFVSEARPGANDRGCRNELRITLPLKR